MANLLILVGTESGNARKVADAVRPVLVAAGHTVDVCDKPAGAADLAAFDVLLVVCASRGAGEVPVNLRPLAETLERERPNLSGHRYGVIALGDRAFRGTYCGGGKQLDRVLALCGAHRLGERLEIDASSQPLPDAEALRWIETWKALI